MPEVRILLVCGSVRAGSVNEAMLRTAAALAPAGVTTDFYEGLAGLPHFNPDDDHDPLPPSVVELRARITAADALLFCTPEYAGDLPGSFKNLLDWTVGGDETGAKPSAWINASTAPTAARPTHESLRRVLTYTGAAIVEEACAHLPLPRAGIGADGLAGDPGLRSALGERVAALVAAVS